MLIKKWLANPLARDLNIDDPSATLVWRKIALDNSFLRQVYEDWYQKIADALPDAATQVLEIGSGAGFMQSCIPGIITSELLQIPGIDAVLDAHHLPFAPAALDAVVLTDVLHHLPEPRRFLSETMRCIRPGGRLIMIEPWVTRWSTFIYKKLHSEPFVTETRHWEFESTGPLSGANIAMPWLIFERDRAEFEATYPGWRIHKIELFMPFCYLVSGGVSMRQLMPGWSYPLWRGLERALQPWMKHLAMFALIVLERVED
jgi:SAM-dependent methyltransferase